MYSYVCYVFRYTNAVEISLNVYNFAELLRDRMVLSESETTWVQEIVCIYVAVGLGQDELL